jgi:hypothetical protein
LPNSHKKFLPETGYLKEKRVVKAKYSHEAFEILGREIFRELPVSQF